MQPFNYTIQAADPFASVMRGFQAGSAIRQDQQQQVLQEQALQMQQQEMQAKLAAQQQQQQAIQALLANKNPGAQDYANASVLVPGMREQLKQSWEMRSTEQQRGDLSHAGQVFAALQSGSADIAAKLLRDRAEAMKAGGRAEEAKHSEVIASIAEQNPALARSMVGMMLAAVPGGDKVISGAATLGQEARAQDMAPSALRRADAEATSAESAARYSDQAARQAITGGIWQTENIRSQIIERGARLGLDKDKLTTETQLKLQEFGQKHGQLPDDARKLVNESAGQAVASSQAVVQFNDLAGRLAKEGAGYGGAGTAAEWLKRATGNQDSITALRQEYTRVMAQGVIKMLPPGPASDKDIQLAREGFPPPTADMAHLAGFLRGMAKLSAYDAVMNDAKAEWVGAAQHLGRAKSDIEVGGVKVPAGTTFSEYARQFLGKKADELNAAAAVGSRSYMRFAAP